MKPRDIARLITEDVRVNNGLLEATSDPEISKYDTPSRRNSILNSNDVGAMYKYAYDIIGDRWPEAELHIMYNPEWAVFYARDIIRGRWPEAEPLIMQKQNPKDVYHYAAQVIKGRWPEAEPIILQEPFWIFYYLCNVVKGRWPEAEPIMMNNPMRAYDYARCVIKGRWPEAEPVILRSPLWASEYAREVIKDRWPEFEEKYLRRKPIAPGMLSDEDEWNDNTGDPVSDYKIHFNISSFDVTEGVVMDAYDSVHEKKILSYGRPGLLYDYALKVKQSRWPEAEPAIIKDPYWAYRYAKHVIKGRWPEAEAAILHDTHSKDGWAYWYALKVIGDRWPEAESLILEDPYWACLYAKNVMQDRWPEFEEKYAKELKLESDSGVSDVLSDVDEWATDYDSWLFDNYKSHFGIEV